eukprot:GHVL01024166.1.p1 GENE.GHVL01024166.1~~GHVL01024166.1.p1  ORF type:complete len:343 (-),score=60.87 GHVL01024166.1:43-1071(-)
MIDESRRFRENIHLLLIGNSGTGKTQLLKFVAKVSIKCVEVVGDASQGLTCRIVGQGNDSAVEAGSLVLADKGICCIDDFSSIMKKTDLAILHEALESQTVTVDKKGIGCKMNARCTLMVATNPKHPILTTPGGKVDTGLPLSFLTRFDLVVVLVDENHKQTNLITDELIGQLTENSNTKTTPEGFIISDDSNDRWSPNDLQTFVSFAQSFEPTIDQPCLTLLNAYYSKLRESCQGGISMRTMEGLLRLCQAHARLMLRDRASIRDAVSVIVLVEAASSQRIINSSALAKEGPKRSKYTDNIYGLEEDEQCLDDSISDILSDSDYDKMHHHVITSLDCTHLL